MKDPGKKGKIKVFQEERGKFPFSGNDASKIYAGDGSIRTGTILPLGSRQLFSREFRCRTGGPLCLPAETTGKSGRAGEGVHPLSRNLFRRGKHSFSLLKTGFFPCGTGSSPPLRRRKKLHSVCPDLAGESPPTFGGGPPLESLKNDRLKLFENPGKEIYEGSRNCCLILEAVFIAVGYIPPRRRRRKNKLSLKKVYLHSELSG